MEPVKHPAHMASAVDVISHNSRLKLVMKAAKSVAIAISARNSDSESISAE